MSRIQYNSKNLSPNKNMWGPRRDLTGLLHSLSNEKYPLLGILKGCSFEELSLCFPCRIHTLNGVFSITNSTQRIEYPFVPVLDHALVHVFLLSEIFLLLL